MFKGGLQDQSVETTRLHTATHLLHSALRKVLGAHVEQKGSNITQERLRFDFVHPQKMTPEELVAVEGLVNDAIQRDLPVTVETMTPEEAKNSGALGFFEHKYGDQVKVYTVGNVEAGIFSKEICGGPHAEHLGELGSFKILKEEASSAGIRRIKAVIGR
jgi:alanyl-tRNA synthetase